MKTHKQTLFFWLFTFMFLTPSFTFAATPSAPPLDQKTMLYCPQPEMDFGTIVEGEKVFLEYPIENRGDKPFEITAIIPVCDCGTGEIISGSPNLNPGDRLTLLVTFDSTNFWGETFKWVTLYGRDGTEFRVYFGGMINPRPGTTPTRPTKVLPKMPGSEPESSPALLVRYFYPSDCGKCQKIIHRVLTPLEKTHKGKIQIIHYNIHDKVSYDAFLKLQDFYHFNIQEFPAILVRDQILEGEKEITKNLAGYVRFYLSESPGGSPPLPGNENRKSGSQWLSDLNLWTIMTAGFIDGINPCAFATLIFFISFLTAGKYTRKKIWVIGVAFLGVSFLTYILIGLGIFNFLRSLSSFHLISLVMGTGVALFSLVFGFLSIRDFLRIRQGMELREMTLQLPLKAKQFIHKIIRKSFKESEDGSVPQDAGLIKLMVLSSLTSFIVTLTESICTGQVYLPVLALISRSGFVNLKAWGLIVLYNAFFILPLIFVLVLAIVCGSLPGITDFTRKHMGLIKLATGVFFFALAALLTVAYLAPLVI